MMRLHTLTASVALLALVGCDSSNPVSQLRFPTVVVFAPSSGDIPVPNDLLYSGTTDATLNIPVANPANVADPLVALNALDGWSTSAPIVLRFSRDIDLATAVAGTTVRMFDVQTLVTPSLPVGGPVLSINRELTAGTEFSLEAATEYPGSTAIRVLLGEPLAASTAAQKRSYMLVVTKGVRDAEGFPVSEDREYFIATDERPFDPTNPATAQLAALQQILAAMEGVAERDAAIPVDDIALTLSFTTQSVGAQLQTALGIAAGNEAAIISAVCAGLPGGCADTTPSPFSTPVAAAGPASIATTAVLLGQGPGFGDVYVGQLTAPYYQTAGSNTSFDQPVSDPTPLANFWRARYPFVTGDTARNLTRFNPLPEATGAETFPLLITLPNGASGQTIPVGGWPVVIFQHGITRNRADMLAVADTLSAAGFAVIAMDLPMHGLAPTGLFSQLFLGYLNGTRRERTFGLDLLDNTTGAATPDGLIDPSGQWFLNLGNLLNSRDNLMQSVADIAALRTTIGTFAVGGQALDSTQVHFVGHSLGGIVGTVYSALADFETVTLAQPGGGIPYLLDASTNFGPVLRAGLASAGVLPNTPNYSRFLFAAQTVVDSADPINHAAGLLARGTPLLLHEVIGGGPGGGLPDQTIPNSVAGRPLAGTEPLIDALGLDPIVATASNVAGVRGAVRFIEGDHASILLPTANAAATAEMQAQIASFLASVGAQVTVTDTSVIDTTP